MPADFIQEALLAVLGLLYGGLLYEVRQLRKAKHSQAQHVQYALLAIALLANHVGLELPQPEKNDD